MRSQSLDDHGIPRVQARGMLRLRAGFSLVELSIVCGIIVIAGIAALPRLFGQSQTTSLMNDAQALVSSINHQRERARILGTLQQVRFAQDGYVLVERDAQGVRLRAVSLATTNRFLAVEFGTGSDAGLCFNSYAAPCLEGSVVLAAQRLLVRLDVAAVTGVVSFSDPATAVDRVATAVTTGLQPKDIAVVTIPADADGRRLKLLKELLPLVQAELGGASVIAHGH